MAQRKRSAYFPSEGDDTVLGEGDSNAAIQGNNKVFHPMQPNITSFPSSRGVLWDRTKTDHAFFLTADSVAPPLYMSGTEVNKLIKEFKDCKSQTSYERTIFLTEYGTMSDSDRNAIQRRTLGSSRLCPFIMVLKEQQEQPQHHHQTNLRVPLTKKYSESAEDLTFDSDATSQMVNNLAKAIRGGRDYSLRSCMRIRAAVRFNVSNANSMYNVYNVSTRFEIVHPNVSFQISRLRNLPFCSSPLTNNLLQNQANSPKMGYLTLNQTRKVLTLLETDPALGTIPTVGIWLSGLTGLDGCTLNGKTVSSNDTMKHPFVWAACVRFLSCENIRERVFVAPMTFLLVTKLKTNTALTQESEELLPLSSSEDFLCSDFAVDLSTEEAEAEDSANANAIIGKFRPLSRPLYIQAFRGSLSETFPVNSVRTATDSLLRPTPALKNRFEPPSSEPVTWSTKSYDATESENRRNEINEFYPVDSKDIEEAGRIDLRSDLCCVNNRVVGSGALPIDDSSKIYDEEPKTPIPRSNKAPAPQRTSHAHADYQLKNHHPYNAARTQCSGGLIDEVCVESETTECISTRKEYVDDARDAYTLSTYSPKPTLLAQQEHQPQPLVSEAKAIPTSSNQYVYSANDRSNPAADIILSQQIQLDILRREVEELRQVILDLTNSKVPVSSRSTLTPPPSAKFFAASSCNESKVNTETAATVVNSLSGSCPQSVLSVVEGDVVQTQDNLGVGAYTVQYVPQSERQRFDDESDGFSVISNGSHTVDGDADEDTGANADRDFEDNIVAESVDRIDKSSEVVSGLSVLSPVYSKFMGESIYMEIPSIPNFDSLGLTSDGRADVRADGRADVRADGRADVRADGRADVRADGRAQLWSRLESADEVAAETITRCADNANATSNLTTTNIQSTIHVQRTPVSPVRKGGLEHITLHSSQMISPINEEREITGTPDKRSPGPTRSSMLLYPRSSAPSPANPLNALIPTIPSTSIKTDFYERGSGIARFDTSFMPIHHQTKISHCSDSNNSSSRYSVFGVYESESLIAIESKYLGTGD